MKHDVFAVHLGAVVLITAIPFYVGAQDTAVMGNVSAHQHGQMFPLPYAEVQICPQTGQDSGSDAETSECVLAYTDLEGDFYADGVSGGEYSIVVNLKGQSSPAVPVESPLGGTVFIEPNITNLLELAIHE
jgi:hypothetical protein